MARSLEDAPSAELQPLPLPDQPWSPRLVHIRAAITGLANPIIPFAILYYDPLPDFQHRLESIVQCYYESRTTHSAKNENHIMQAAVQAAWHAPFTSLLPDRIFFIYAWSAVPTASPQVKRAASLSFGIATPGPLSKRWLTTFAVPRGEELVAWRHEIDMRAEGKEEPLPIVLGEENMLVLADSRNLGALLTLPGL